MQHNKKTKAARTGIIGCGVISKIYAQNASRFNNIELVACADINQSAAQALAHEYGITSLDVEELLMSKDIDVVINLTIPKAHVEISRQALESGKHVHSEKPLGIEVREAKALLECAHQKGLRLACAPDTFLGGAHQTCRKLLDDGWIGQPISGTAFMMTPAPETWHPNPTFFYERGGGPLLDMAPYYLTVLINLLGPIQSVTAITSKSFSERIVTAPQNTGARIAVDVPTHATGILQFASGVLITTIFSWDIRKQNLPIIEIYGSEGSLSVPDPNAFGGVVCVGRANSEWHEVPLTHGYNDNSRMLAVADMVDAMNTDRPHRASGELAFHVLETICAFEESSIKRETVTLESTCPRPAPLPISLLDGEIE